MKKPSTVRVVCGVLVENGSILITQRPEHVPLALFWEFPGGKVDGEESLEEGMVRELREELGIEVAVLRLLETTHHHVDRQSLSLFFFHCQRLSGELTRCGVKDFRWVKPAELQHYKFPDADETFIRNLPQLLANYF